MYRGGDLLETLHGSMPEWLLLLAALVTRLGDVWIVISITVIASWLLTWRRSTSGSNTPQQAETGPPEATPAIWMVSVVVGGLAVMTTLKYVFVLPRPALVAATPAVLPPALESSYVSTVTIGGYGFPSGHALGATVAYGLLALTPRTGTRRVRLAVAGVIVLAVSCSRVVLAVHYPGDIVAGIAVGVAYLVAVLWLLERSPFDRTTSAFTLTLGLALVALVVSDVTGRSVTYTALAAGGLTAWSIGRPRSRPRTTPHAVIATLALGALAGLAALDGSLVTVAVAGVIGAIAVVPGTVILQSTIDGQSLCVDDGSRSVRPMANAGPTGFRHLAYPSSMSDNSRELGVELGDLGDALESQTYPVGEDELFEQHGDAEIEMGDETATLEELLEPLNEDEYESADEVTQAIMNMVSDDAIGRKNYSDRTPPAVGEDRQDEGAPDQEGQREQESF
ncbi:Membrane-associated phospholipid phosphatase [Natronorubrum thiooxidans]|uniref:Membrane-associated phospholipid phosphatase n=2 Tax=Natronorubrum thiooxidans TaxID=308853 RepID=A0A1N7H2A7_9EURY|nr:Membrane-associated phospholipid phosphatase [Natronorubrum thiooxidans]